MTGLVSLSQDGRLVVKCPYDFRDVPKSLGGRWQQKSKTWVMTFTVENIKTLLERLKGIQVTQAVQKKLEEQIDKEQELEDIAEKAKHDAPVSFRVDGIKLALYNYQKHGVLFSIKSGDGVLLADEMGLGKATTLDTDIMTPSGPVQMRDVHVGDSVIGKNGQSVTVVGEYLQGVLPVYRVTFSDGSFLDCSEDHLWSVNTPTRKHRDRPYLVKTTRELLKLGLTRKNGENGERWNWYVPMVEPVCFNGSELPIHPYVMGVLLGDGGLSCGRLRFSTADEFVAKSVERLMGDEWRVRKEKSGKYDYVLALKKNNPHHPVHVYLRQRGLKGMKSDEKYIPFEYLYASCEDREHLLQGLMDADGIVQFGERGVAACFCTTSQRLRDGMLSLCQSFGGVVSRRPKQPFYYDKEGNKVYGKPAWIMTISVPRTIQPFRLPRKFEKYPNRHLKYEPTRAITSIEYQGDKETKCIKVDADDGLFVVRDFIVTHNTVQAIATACYKKYNRGAKHALILTPASLKWNWPLEIEKFTDEPYVVVDGLPDERVSQWLRDDVFFHVVNFELLTEDLFGGRDLTIRPTDKPKTVARKEAIAKKAKARAEKLVTIRQRRWDMVIVDEAHALKSPRAKRTKNVRSLESDFKMALTGTPIDGRLEELHSLMEFVTPGLFETRTRFLQKHATFDFWGRVTEYKGIDEVRRKMKPFFLRRLKRDVLKDLPDKIYENRLVTFTPREAKLYSELATRAHEVTEDAEAMVAVIRCKQFCDHPNLVDLATSTVPSKMQAFLEVVNEVVVENGHKAVIFSQYATMNELIKKALDDMGIRYLYIWSDTPKKERAEMQERFNTDDAIDCMVGTDAMSLGLNFMSADCVINYDDYWSPSVMSQREDRCHRIGQKNVVTVINFICRDTIEERIRDVLYTKSAVSSDALGDETEEVVLRRLNPKEIAKLV
jgi:superfamily II DNA or RNA helicase